jgi:hypothetical protein
MIERLKEKIRLVTFDDWENVCLEVFKYQFDHNSLYEEYCTLVKIRPEKINSVADIPFLPIEFFKTHEVKSGNWQTNKLFRSSGTGSMGRSTHHVWSPDNYLSNAVQLFEDQYGKLEDFVVLALLPSYLEQGDSSLIFMIDHFIEKTGSNSSGYFLNANDKLVNTAKRAILDSKRVLVVGVTYALLDFAETGSYDFSGCVIMETGGMKGRREEIIREDLHNRLCAAFGVEKIHSEYGMTELLSQAYSIGDGEFIQTPKLSVKIRDLNDPFSEVANGRIGGVNLIDLANLTTVSFIETKDIGRVNENGTFSVLGRYDNSDIRGCNMLL